MTMMGASARRDSYLDSLRGGFHVLMLVDHLPLLFPGMFTLVAWVYECLGYASVAEGFVILSGYMAGLVYPRIRREQGGRTLWRKAVQRALEIYVTYLAAVVFLLGCVRLGGAAGISWGGWEKLFEQPLLSATLAVATLKAQPSFLEILPMYSAFLIATPVIIQQLERGRGWLVASASVAVWGLDQFDFWPRAGRFGFFSAPGWQLLFVVGLLCGHKSGRAPHGWLPRGWRLQSLAYCGAAMFFALRHDVFHVDLDPRWLQRSSPGPLRLLNVGCLFLLLAWLRSWVGKGIAWKGLAFLSKHSLQVFAFHLVPIYALALLLPEPLAPSWGWQSVFVVLSLAALFEIAWVASVIKGWVALRAGWIARRAAQ